MAGRLRLYLGDCTLRVCWSASIKNGGRGPRFSDDCPFDYSSGTISSATMLMILISGLTAGPAVSL